MFAIVDCNSFYCSCERLFRPDLENKPVVVLSNNDGCIIARTDEAKKLGISMGGPYFMCKDELQKNNVAVFSSNYNLYGDMSWRVMETLRSLFPADCVEVYSVDECFIDLSTLNIKDYSEIALKIKHTVELWTGIKVSIGIAPTKVLAKVANRLAKKDKAATKCQMVLKTQEQIADALLQTAVRDIWGIGRQYAEKCSLYYGINNAWQLMQMSEDWARKNLGGVVGVRLLKELKGFSCIELKDQLQTKKMIATTRMFGSAVYDKASIKEAVATYTARAAEKLRRQKSVTGLISVFVITNDIEQKFGYHPKGKSLYATLQEPSADTGVLLKYTLPLVDKLFVPGPRYLKAGVCLMNLFPDNTVQQNLFSNQRADNKKLMQALDNINFALRDELVKFAATGIQRSWKMRQTFRSKRYTTRWNELYWVH